jgi:hypothetical protein
LGLFRISYFDFRDYSIDFCAVPEESFMLAPILLLLASAAPGDPGTLPIGVIRGVVLHAGDQKPVAGAEVGLRVRLEGRFVPIAETTTGAQGRFTFRQLPVGEDFEYLPGANRDGVHYPGPRVHLTRGHPADDVLLTVCDAVRSPSPLVARRHEIFICPEPGLVKVSETILIDNPSSSSFVGQAADGMSPPITLRLSIPADFQRTTFDQEFFGRHFSLADGKLVTSIPWTPGPRELKFTYVLANPESRFHWDRPLDLPCSELTLIIRTDRPDEVCCNLGARPLRHGDVVTFALNGRNLPAGQVIRVDLGRLPMPMMAYGRWLALAVLIGLVGGTGLILGWRRPFRRTGTS